MFDCFMKSLPISDDSWRRVGRASGCLWDRSRVKQRAEMDLELRTFLAAHHQSVAQVRLEGQFK